MCYFIGEKFFFDRLFYQKSAWYGYVRNLGEPVKEIDMPATIKLRVKDLIQLLTLQKQSAQASSVLGAENDGKYIIALIGDSFVYGQGIKTEERFGELLEQKLNKIYPTRVIILAQPGDSAIENYTKFQLVYTHMAPSLYIIGLVDNDLVFLNFDKYPLEHQLLNEITPLCPGKIFMWFPMPNPPWEELVVKQYKPSVSPDYQNVCLLKNMTEKMLKLSSRILFYSFYENTDPAGQSVDYEKMDAETLKTYTSTIQQAGGYVVYQPNNSPYEQVSQKEGHPSAGMNQRYAEQLYAEILSNPKWGFPPSQKK